MATIDTTGIGSLPFAEASEAIEHVFRSYSVPFFPQLVQHNYYKANSWPQMLVEVVPPLVLTCLQEENRDASDLTTLWQESLSNHIDQLPGFTEFVEAIPSSNAQRVKLQLCGPLSAIAILNHRIKTKIPPHVATIFESMIIETAQKMLERAISAAPEKSILFIWDEGLPLTIGKASDLETLNRICAAIESERVVSGVHCCAQFDPKKFLGVGNDRYLALDLSLFQYKDENVARHLEQILKNGGLIAGVVNTNPNQKPLTSEDATRWIVRLAGQSSRFPIILSGGCGTGQHSVLFENSLTEELGRIAK